MAYELILRILLESPPVGVDFGLQKGSGSNYETIQKQRSAGADILFEFDIKVTAGKNGQPGFIGSVVQGKPGHRFIYIDIGTYAGQEESEWDRRLKIPLNDITMEMIETSLSGNYLVIATAVPGKGKDGA